MTDQQDARDDAADGRDTRADGRDRLTRILLASVLFVLAGVGALEVARLKRAATNGDVLVEIRAGNDRIKDCTDPTGKCFRRGQASTAAAVVGIIDGTKDAEAVAIVCARRELDDDEIRACIYAEFARLGPAPAAP